MFYHIYSQHRPCTFPLTTANYLIQYVTDYVAKPIDYLGCAQTKNALDIGKVFSETIVKIHPLPI
jgi:5'-nucleotidase/UDP-sugar diphosphatase